MKEFFKKDLTLKILSVVFAVFLWFVINPVKTEYFSVPLNVINAESLKAKGIVLNNNAYQKPVAISVRERRDVLNNIKDSDFEVTLDLSKVKTVADKVIELEAPVYLGRENISANNIDLKPKSVTLNLGKIEENPFIVQVETTGKLPAGYEIISKTVVPETVSIQALDYIVNSVGSVKAYVDVSGLNKTLQVRKQCKVFDKSGQEMPELSKKLTVDITIEVGKRVPVIPITEGIPAKNFIEGAYTVKPDKILITGELDIMSKVNGVKTIPIKIDDATQTFTTNVLLQLPEGVKHVGSTREVSVTVEIIPLVERSLPLSAENITIVGKSTDTSLTYEITGPVTIKLRGKIEDLNKITVTNLLANIDVGTIDVDTIEEETSNVPIKVTLPTGISQVDEVLVPVKITKGE